MVRGFFFSNFNFLIPMGIEFLELDWKGITYAFCEQLVTRICRNCGSKKFWEFCKEIVQLKNMKAN